MKRTRAVKGSKELTHVHTLWWNLLTYLCKWYFNMRPRFVWKDGRIGSTKRLYKEFSGTSKIVGHEAIMRMHNFHNKHKDMREVSCDDGVFSSSHLFLIPHETKTQYMGLTVIFVPQLAIDEPNHFFLYPQHLNQLIRELLKIQKRMKKKTEV